MSGGAGRRSTLPGFGLTMGLTLTWLSVIILIPLAGLFLKTFELSLDQFWGILTSRRTLNALKISFGLAFAAALVNLVMGMIIVWALVRYRFPGRRHLRCHRRYSLCAADRGGRRRADLAVRAKRLARRAAGRTRHQGGVHADRDFHRHDLHRHSLRGADGAAGADRSRRRDRGSRRQPRRQPLAYGLQGDPAEPDPGAADRALRWPSRAPSANTAR